MNLDFSNVSLLHILQSIKKFHPGLGDQAYLTQLQHRNCPQSLFSAGKGNYEQSVIHAETSKKRREESCLLHGHDFSNCPITWYHQLVFLFRKINNRNSNSLLSWHPSRYTFIINISNMFSDTLLWERVQVVSSVGKESICKEGDPGSIPGSGRSPGEGNSYPLQYSGLENSMDYTVRHDGVTFTFTFHVVR